MSEHESHGHSFMHPINTPCRYLCVLKHLCLEYRNQGHLRLFLKDICCAKSVGSLRSEFCHDPRKQGGQEHREHQQHTYRAEIQGDATLYLCYTIKGAGWVVQPGPSTDLPQGQKVSILCRRLGTTTDDDMSGNTHLWLSASPRLITRTHGAILLFCRAWSGAQSTQIGLHLNTP